MLKPTAYLTFVIDQELEPMGVASLLSRAFTYIAPIKVVFDTGLERRNRVQLEVKLPNRPYWLAGNPEGDELWETVVSPWLVNKLNTLQNTITALNNPGAKSFEYAVDFSFLDLVLEGRVVSLPFVENLLYDIDLELNRARNAS